VVDTLGIPKVPAPDNVGPTPGQSFVQAPAPLPPLALNDPNAQQHQPPPPVQPGQAVAGMDVTWMTLEWKIDLKKLAAEWAAVFNDKSGKRIFPDASPQTSILWVEVEREELIGANQWGNKTTLKPLPITPVAQVADTVWGKLKNPDEEEAFRLWAEKNQLNIVEPPFFQTVSGDTWKTVSTAPAVDPAAPAAAVVEEGPFDPANPPQGRQLTSDEKRQVYVHNQQQKKEKERAAIQEGRAKAAAAEAARKARSTTPSTPGGNRGFAPIPLAADSEFGARPGTGAPARPGTAPPARPGAGAGNFARPGTEGRPAARPIAAPAAGERRPMPTGGEFRPIVPRTGEIGNPGVPTVFQPNPVLNGPFDPMEVVLPNPAGGPNAAQPTDITVWAHDPAAQPGKIYRYRMRYYVKNPLHLTHGFTKNPKDSTIFAIASEFSPWMTASAPQNVHFFFAKKKANPRNLGLVDNVEVDVFKREKGVWTKQSFTVVPGDSIGQSANGVDFTTGTTIVDLRVDTRNDVRILIADETGTVQTRTLQGDINDEWYKELQQKVLAPAGPNAALNQ